MMRQMLNAPEASVRESHPLRSDEREDLMCTIDSENSASGSDGYTLENPCNLHKCSAARVKAQDIVGCTDDPDAIPASRDLTCISANLVELLSRGIKAEDIA